MEQLQHPQFRVFFAVQQAVLWQKSLNPTLQIFCRGSIPQELKLGGSFSSFVVVLRNLIQLALRTYTGSAAQRLVFITTDVTDSQLVVRITAGGGGFKFGTSEAISESSQAQPHLLTESIRLIETQFSGHFELKTFSQRGVQAIIKLPTQTDNQNHDRS